MKNSRFFGWSGAALALIGLAVVGEMYWHFVREKAEGARLADEGRQALGALEFEKAILRFDAALTKPLDKHSKAEVYARRGEARNRLGANEAAITDLTMALGLDPDFGPAYAERARAHQTKGEKEKAIEDYGAAIAHGSSGPENYLARGALLLESGQTPETAAADFTEVIKQTPDNVIAFILRARAYAAANNPEAAIASYDGAIGLDPQNQEARAERGDLYSKKGDVAKAMADYAELRTSKGEMSAARSAEISPAFPVLETAELLRQANLKMASGRLDEAIDLCNRILQMNIPLPLASTALQNRGNAYHLKGDQDRAMQDYEQAIRFNPANAGAYVNRGFIYALRNDSRAALMDYNEALRFDPKLYEALYNRALTNRTEGDLEAAERDLNAALAVNQQAVPAYLTRASIAVSQGKLDRAMADVEAAIKIDPEVAEAYIARADLLSRKNAYARAIVDFEKAASLKSAVLYQALNGLAWLRATCPEKSFRDGKKAVADALRACELSSWGQGSTVDTLAAAYAENGEFEKAANFQLFALTLPGIGAEDQVAAEKRVALYRSRRAYHGTGTE